MGRVGRYILSDLFRIVPGYFRHSDARGEIIGILNCGVWRELNLIKSEAGVVRGGHYHENTEECFVILSGKVRVVFRKRGEDGNWHADERCFGAGDVFIIPPCVEHTINVLETAQWINLLNIPIDEKDPDFHKYGDGDCK